MQTKLSVEIEIKPFQVPVFVIVQDAPDYVSDDHGIPLSALDSLTLDKLCRDFRDEVFKKAGKEQPPQVKEKP